MLTLLVGKTFSGKNTYVKNSGLNILKTHTTRPVRPTEKGNEYYFETKQNYIRKTLNGIVFAPREYETAMGTWAYWVELDDIKIAKDPIMIVDLEGAKEIINSQEISDVKVLYINTPVKEIRERIKNSDRGKTENLDETSRRLEDDIKVHQKLDSIVKNYGIQDITTLVIGNRV